MIIVSIVKAGFLLGLYFYVCNLVLYMRSIGLHIRFSTHFESVIDKALRFQSDIFQCFFINQNNSYIPLTPELISYYAQLRDRFTSLYAHSSYYINIADHRVEEHPYLKKELKRARHLGFTHLIVHPGAITGMASREQALETVVRRINTLMKHEKDIILILENSGHSKKALGGDVHDLFYIRSRLDMPEKVKFCIDTAHAHVYGYDLRNTFEEWMQLLNELIGDSLALLHLNDTKEPLGSNNDRHCMIGQGQLGFEVLRKCVSHPFFEKIPIILELPVIAEKEEMEALTMVRSWANSPK